MDSVRLPSAPKSLPKWIWVAAIFSGIGLFDATQTVLSMRAEGMHHAWIALYYCLFISWLPWALATPLIFRLGEKYPATHWRKLSTWAAHLAACLAVGVVSAFWIALWDWLLNPWAKPGGRGALLDLWRHMFTGGILLYLILYSLIFLVFCMIESREQLARQQTETAQLNEQLSKAQLSALRRQIEPHFLFNTLNAIAGLVREQRNDTAVSMIAGLSDFLRRVIDHSDQQQVPLAEELDFAHKYLDIQKIRFAERLQYKIDVPNDLLSAQVPSLILQPMVENAVKHGIAKRVQGGEIRIGGDRANGKLTLRVYNDGPALPIHPTTGEPGIGVTNVRTRLRSLYGENFQLNMANKEPGGVEVELSLPFEPGKSDKPNSEPFKN